MGVTLFRQIADVVLEMGAANCNDLVIDPRFKQWSRLQILSGLKNARKAGLIYCDPRKPKKGSGSAGSEPSMHYPGGKPLVAPKPRRVGVAPPASVWELGSMPARAWPPVGQGRRFNLLGGWAD